MKKENIEAKDVTQEVINSWKAEYEDVFKIIVEDKVGYFRTPTRAVYSYASTAGTKDAMRFNEAILKGCFLGGDQELLNEKNLITMGKHVIKILNIKESSLEKL